MLVCLKLCLIIGDDLVWFCEVMIIYFGGDDVFVVGVWDDVIEFGIEFWEWFYEFI